MGEDEGSKQRDETHRMWRWLGSEVGSCLGLFKSPSARDDLSYISTILTTIDLGSLFLSFILHLMGTIT